MSSDCSDSREHLIVSDQALNPVDISSKPSHHACLAENKLEYPNLYSSATEGVAPYLRTSNNSNLQFRGSVQFGRSGQFVNIEDLSRMTHQDDSLFLNGTLISNNDFTTNLGLNLTERFRTSLGDPLHPTDKVEEDEAKFELRNLVVDSSKDGSTYVDQFPIEKMKLGPSFEETDHYEMDQRNNNDFSFPSAYSKNNKIDTGIDNPEYPRLSKNPPDMKSAGLNSLSIEKNHLLFIESTQKPSHNIHHYDVSSAEMYGPEVRDIFSGDSYVKLDQATIKLEDIVLKHSGPHTLSKPPAKHNTMESSQLVSDLGVCKDEYLDLQRGKFLNGSNPLLSHIDDHNEGLNDERERSLTNQLDSWADQHANLDPPPPECINVAHWLPTAFRTLLPYSYLNRVQSRIFRSTFFTNEAVAVAAPTGTGKTAIFEIAILRKLIESNPKFNYILSPRNIDFFDNWIASLGSNSPSAGKPPGEVGKITGSLEGGKSVKASFFSTQSTSQKGSNTHVSTSYIRDGSKLLSDSKGKFAAYRELKNEDEAANRILPPPPFLMDSHTESCSHQVTNESSAWYDNLTGSSPKMLGKVLYLAPLRALCMERYQDWTEKLKHLGLTVLACTGDISDTDENDEDPALDELDITLNQSSSASDAKGSSTSTQHFLGSRSEPLAKSRTSSYMKDKEIKKWISLMKSADIIVATPEKWDSLTRRVSDSEELISLISLVCIDEVHTLGENRGAVIEAVISRMRVTMEHRRRRIISDRILVEAEIESIEKLACSCLVCSSHMDHPDDQGVPLPGLESLLPYQSTLSEDGKAPGVVDCQREAKFATLASSDLFLKSFPGYMSVSSSFSGYHHGAFRGGFREFVQYLRTNPDLVQFCENSTGTQDPFRIIAVSATCPNLSDVGRWIGASPRTVFSFDDSYRQVPLKTHVIPFDYQSNGFLFERFLDTKVLDIVRKHGCGRPALVFCSSRGGVIRTAETVVKEITRQIECSGAGSYLRDSTCFTEEGPQRLILAHPLFSQMQDEDSEEATGEESEGFGLDVFESSGLLSRRNSGRDPQKLHEDPRIRALNRCREAAERAQDPRLASCLRLGVGFHSAGASAADRSLVETLFRCGALPLLCTTTTLAMGVNLPAYLVVVKGTQGWRGPGEGYKDYERSQVLQMVGRAGRVQFHSQGGVAVICTNVNTSSSTGTATSTHSKPNGSSRFLSSNFSKFSSLMEPVDSSLKDRIVEFLCAEVCLGTVSTAQDALTWLRGTFFYTRLATTLNGGREGDSSNRMNGNTDTAAHGKAATALTPADIYIRRVVAAALHALSFSGCVEIVKRTFIPSTQTDIPTSDSDLPSSAPSKAGEGFAHPGSGVEGRGLELLEVFRPTKPVEVIQEIEFVLKNSKEGNQEWGSHLILCPLGPGVVMTKHYISFETIALFKRIPSECDMPSLLALLCNAREIRSSLTLRRDEKKLLRDIKERSGMFTVKSGKEGTVSTVEDKAFQLVQIGLGRLRLDGLDMTGTYYAKVRGHDTSMNTSMGATESGEITRTRTRAPPHIRMEVQSVLQLLERVLKALTAWSTCEEVRSAQLPLISELYRAVKHRLWPQQAVPGALVLLSGQKKPSSRSKGNERFASRGKNGSTSTEGVVQQTRLSLKSEGGVVKMQAKRGGAKKASAASEAAAGAPSRTLNDSSWDIQDLTVEDVRARAHVDNRGLLQVEGITESLLPLLSLLGIVSIVDLAGLGQFVNPSVSTEFSGIATSLSSMNTSVDSVDSSMSTRPAEPSWQSNTQLRKLVALSKKSVAFWMSVRAHARGLLPRLSVSVTQIGFDYELGAAELRIEVCNDTPMSLFRVPEVTIGPTTSGSRRRSQRQGISSSEQDPASLSRRAKSSSNQPTIQSFFKKPPPLQIPNSLPISRNDPVLEGPNTPRTKMGAPPPLLHMQGKRANSKRSRTSTQRDSEFMEVSDCQLTAPSGSLSGTTCTGSPTGGYCSDSAFSCTNPMGHPNESKVFRMKRSSDSSIPSPSVRNGGSPLLAAAASKLHPLQGLDRTSSFSQAVNINGSAPLSVDPANNNFNVHSSTNGNVNNLDFSENAGTPMPSPKRKRTEFLFEEHLASLNNNNSNNNVSPLLNSSFRGGHLLAMDIINSSDSSDSSDSGEMEDAPQIRVGRLPMSDAKSWAAHRYTVAVTAPSYPLRSSKSGGNSVEADPTADGGGLLLSKSNIRTEQSFVFKVINPVLLASSGCLESTHSDTRNTNYDLSGIITVHLMHASLLGMDRKVTFRPTFPPLNSADVFGAKDSTIRMLMDHGNKDMILYRPVLVRAGNITSTSSEAAPACLNPGSSALDNSFLESSHLGISEIVRKRLAARSMLTPLVDADASSSLNDTYSSVRSSVNNRSSFATAGSTEILTDLSGSLDTAGDNKGLPLKAAENPQTAQDTISSHVSEKNLCVEVGANSTLSNFYSSARNSDVYASKSRSSSSSRGDSGMVASPSDTRSVGADMSDEITWETNSRRDQYVEDRYVPSGGQNDDSSEDLDSLLRFLTGAAAAPRACVSGKTKKKDISMDPELDLDLDTDMDMDTDPGFPRQQSISDASFSALVTGLTTPSSSLTRSITTNTVLTDTSAHRGIVHMRVPDAGSASTSLNTSRFANSGDMGASGASLSGSMSASASGSGFITGVSESSTGYYSSSSGDERMPTSHTRMGGASLSASGMQANSSTAISLRIGSSGKRESQPKFGLPTAHSRPFGVPLAPPSLLSSAVDSSKTKQGIKSVAHDDKVTASSLKSPILGAPKALRGDGSVKQPEASRVSDSTDSDDLMGRRSAYLMPLDGILLEDANSSNPMNRNALPALPQPHKHYTFEPSPSAVRKEETSAQTVPLASLTLKNEWMVKGVGGHTQSLSYDVMGAGLHESSWSSDSSVVGPCSRSSLIFGEDTAVVQSSVQNSLCNGSFSASSEGPLALPRQENAKRDSGALHDARGDDNTKSALDPNERSGDEGFSLDSGTHSSANKSQFQPQMVRNSEPEKTTNSDSAAGVVELPSDSRKSDSSTIPMSTDVVVSKQSMTPVCSAEPPALCRDVAEHEEWSRRIANNFTPVMDTPVSQLKPETQDRSAEDPSKGGSIESNESIASVKSAVPCSSSTVNTTTPTSAISLPGNVYSSLFGLGNSVETYHSLFNRRLIPSDGKGNSPSSMKLSRSGLVGLNMNMSFGRGTSRMSVSGASRMEVDGSAVTQISTTVPEKTGQPAVDLKMDGVLTINPVLSRLLRDSTLENTLDLDYFLRARRRSSYISGISLGSDSQEKDDSLDGLQEKIPPLLGGGVFPCSPVSHKCPSVIRRGEAVEEKEDLNNSLESAEINLGPSKLLRGFSRRADVGEGPMPLPITSDFQLLRPSQSNNNNSYNSNSNPQPAARLGLSSLASSSSEQKADTTGSRSGGGEGGKEKLFMSAGSRLRQAISDRQAQESGQSIRRQSLGVLPTHSVSNAESLPVEKLGIFGRRNSLMDTFSQAWNASKAFCSDSDSDSNSEDSVVPVDSLQHLDQTEDSSINTTIFNRNGDHSSASLTETTTLHKAGGDSMLLRENVVLTEQGQCIELLDPDY